MTTFRSLVATTTAALVLGAVGAVGAVATAGPASAAAPAGAGRPATVPVHQPIHVCNDASGEVAGLNPPFGQVCVDG